MKKIILTVALATFGIAGVANANLLTNGDFETGDLSGWKAKGDISINTWANGNDVAAFHNWSDTGTANTVLRQSFYVDPAWSGVEVSFDFRFGTGTNLDENFFNSFLRIETTTNNFTRESIITQRDHMTGWTNVSTFISFDSINIEDIDPNGAIVFSMRDYKGDWSNAALDNVSVAAPVPEPATMLLFGAGLAGLIGLRSRGKKK